MNSSIEKEFRIEVNNNDIKRIIDNTLPYSAKKHMVDITCGKYEFDSLKKTGYICRIRKKEKCCFMEVKKYLKDESCIEKSISIFNVADGISFFKLLGLKPYLILDRYRQVRKYGNLKIFIDEITDIGNYIEIEYQNSSRKEAIDFLKRFNLSIDFKPKYGDIVRQKINDDVNIKKKLIKKINEYIC